MKKLLIFLSIIFISMIFTSCDANDVFCTFDPQVKNCLDANNEQEINNDIAPAINNFQFRLIDNPQLDKSYTAIIDQEQLTISMFLPEKYYNMADDLIPYIDATYISITPNILNAKRQFKTYKTLAYLVNGTSESKEYTFILNLIPATNIDNAITDVSITKFFIRTLENPTLPKSILAQIDNTNRTITIPMTSLMYQQYADGLIPYIEGNFAQINPSVDTPRQFKSNKNNTYYDLFMTDGSFISYQIIMDIEGADTPDTNKIFDESTDIIFVEDTTNTKVNVQGEYKIEIQGSQIYIVMRQNDIDYYKNNVVYFTFNLIGSGRTFQTNTLVTQLPTQQNIFDTDGNVYTMFINYKPIEYDYRIEDISFSPMEDFTYTTDIRYQFYSDKHNRFFDKDILNTPEGRAIFNYKNQDTEITYKVDDNLNLNYSKSQKILTSNKITPRYDNILGEIYIPYELRPEINITFSQRILPFTFTPDNRYYALDTYNEIYDILVSDDEKTITLTPKYSANQYQSEQTIIKIIIGVDTEEQKQYVIKFQSVDTYWKSIAGNNNIAKLYLNDLGLQQMPDVYDWDFLVDRIDYRLVYTNISPIGTSFIDVSNFFTAKELNDLIINGNIQQKASQYLVQDYFTRRNMGEDIHYFQQEYNFIINNNYNIIFSTNYNIVDSVKTHWRFYVLNDKNEYVKTDTLHSRGNSIIPTAKYIFSSELDESYLIHNYTFLGNDLNRINSGTRTLKINETWHYCKDISFDNNLVIRYNQNGRTTNKVINYRFDRDICTLPENVHWDNWTLPYKEYVNETNLIKLIPTQDIQQPSTILQRIRIRSYEDEN